LQDEQQQQQQREVLGFLAAARQDTKQGHKCSAGGAAAAVASAADGLAVAHTLPVSPVKQHSAALPLGDHRWSRSSASADGAVIAAAGSQHAAAGVDAWQHQQEQWQQQWQQQQQVWQQQVEQQALVASEPEDGAQQQVEEEFSLCPVRVQPGSAAQAEQQQQQGHTAEVEEAEYQVGVCLQPGDAAATAAAHEPGGKDKVCSTTAADSDDFGDFQGSPHADAPGTYFRGSTDAAATETAEAVGEKPAAAAEVCDRNSFMVHGTAERTPLAPDAAAADPAAATATTASADASSFAQASTPEAAAEALLAQGNAAYTAGKYSPAVQCYAKALGSLGGSIAATTSEAGVLLWIKCSLNLACCHLRLGQFKQCVALCDNLLEGEQWHARA
jgi:tetratricopeptide (TPR) repeat protein